MSTSTRSFTAAGYFFCFNKLSFIELLYSPLEGFVGGLASIVLVGFEDLSNFFAGIWPDDEPPPSFILEPWVCGPRLPGTIGALACKVNEFLEGGDHWIIIGSVIDLYQQEESPNPLLYYGGQYRKLLDEKK